MTAEGKALAIESLQLLTLLLPPDHRRKLHLLLRFMAKVTSNTQLVLDKEIPMKTLVIQQLELRLAQDLILIELTDDQHFLPVHHLFARRVGLR